MSYPKSKPLAFMWRNFYFLPISLFLFVVLLFYYPVLSFLATALLLVLFYRSRYLIRYFRNLFHVSLNSACLFINRVIFYFYKPALPWIETQKILVFKRALDQNTEAITNNLRAPFLKGYECLRMGTRKTKIETTSLYSEMGLPGRRSCYQLNLFNIGDIDFDKNTSHYSYILSSAAKELGCAINTGCLGLTSGFLRGGADLIWRIREEDYKEYENMSDLFENQMFLNTVSRSYIKMIEIQTSGKSFLNSNNMLDLSETIFLIQKLRLVSKGKPVGICLRPSDIDKINPITGNIWLREADPDFITIEEDVNYPEQSNLKFLIDKEESLLKSVKAIREAIKGYRLRTKIIASGKFISEFELLRMLAFGADNCITRTPFEWLLNGKLNAPISCSTNARSLIKNFHQHTLKATAGIMGECGFQEINHISADIFLKRVDYTTVKNLKEVYQISHNNKSAFIYRGYNHER